MFNFIYLLLKERILTKVPAIKDVQFYMEQDKNTKGVLVISPSLYIRFKDIPMRSLGNGIQEADLEFDLIHLSDCLYDNDKRIHNFEPGSSNHLERDIQVYKKLANYNGMLSDLPAFADLKGTENDVLMFKSLDRTMFSPPSTFKSIMKSAQSYKCYAKDYTANKQFQNIIRDFEIIL